MIITAAQCRVGRDLLGISQRELARRANVDWGSIHRLEGGATATRFPTQWKIRNALAAAGLEFTGDGGVRFRKRPPTT